MRRILLSLLLLLLPASCLLSAPTDHFVIGRVVDNISGDGIVGANVSLLDANNRTIATATTDSSEYWNRNGIYRFKLPGKGRYVVRATYKGYEEGSVRLALHSLRESDISAEDIRLARQYRVLPELEVRASKVKMVMRGDTIIYNADAFNLADGSMLDALVARLPGCKLTKDGRIYVNGKYVESLLVNGQDFFSGNPKLALENLPAYTVKRIKVFDRMGADSKLMGRDMHDKQYVMDVRLKKEYSVGYMGNLEAGGGTDHRYMLRDFGMKFSEASRLLAFANVNNLSNDEVADVTTGGDWSSLDTPQGLLATRSAGLSYLHMLGNEMSYIGTNNLIKRTDADNQSATHTQTYLNGGDRFGNTTNTLRNETTGFYSKEALKLLKRKWTTENILTLQYNHDKGWTTSKGETLLGSKWLNTLLTQGRHDNKQWNLAFDMNTNLRLYADMLRAKAKGSYDHLEATSFDAYQAQYADRATPVDYRNNYRPLTRENMTVEADLSYLYGLGNAGLRLGYAFKHERHNTNSPLFRLDRVLGCDTTRYDVLPSTRLALDEVKDVRNSYDATDCGNDHTVYLSYFNYWPSIGGNLSVYLPIVFRNSWLRYERTARQHIHRNRVFFNPEVTLEMGKRWRWTLDATLSSAMPDLMAMATYEDDADPLTIRLGNPQLKDVHRYHVSVSARHSGAHRGLLHAQWAYHQTDNAVAWALCFDDKRGVSTLQPVSVNGNWHTDASLGYSREMGRDGKWNVENRLTATYQHHVDMAATATNTTSMRSIVHNWEMGLDLRINWRPCDAYELTLHGGGSYFLVSSRREGFSQIRAGNYRAGANAYVDLPWHLQLSTDLTMVARRGYQAHQMNTSDWVWNAQLSRTFCKGRLLAKLQGYDILHELSTTSYAVDAQGRTETWHNAIPRYAMISLAWRFNANPKR